MDKHEQPPASDLVLRPVTETDWPILVGLLQETVAARETFTYDANLTSLEIQDLWASSNVVFVAEATDGSIAGTAKMGRNQGGPGAHVATASFLVAPLWRGRGVGRLLCRHALSWAIDAGFRAMQFNAVVATNGAAIKLWRSEGFNVVGVVPEAFQHPYLGFVDLLVMHRRF